MDNNQDKRRHSFGQFSLRAMLALMMLVAAFAGGWVAHREWAQQDLAKAIADALKESQAPIQVEFIEGTDAFVTRGRKEDVDAVMSVIKDLEEK